MMKLHALTRLLFKANCTRTISLKPLTKSAYWNFNVKQVGTKMKIFLQSGVPVTDLSTASNRITSSTVSPFWRYGVTPDKGPPLFKTTFFLKPFFPISMSYLLFLMGWGCSSVGECWTSTLPMQVSLPGTARDFNPKVNFQRRLSYVCVGLYLCAH